MIKSTFEPRLFFSEAIGTACLLFFGLSIVIFNWGDGSPVKAWIPLEGLRRLVTGFLFGSVGCLVTLSPVGKISGAHINPVVSLAFWLRGKMRTSTMIGYILSQMIGAVIGSFPLLLWGDTGRSIQYGITLPGNNGLASAVLGEAITTAGLILYLYTFIGTKKLRNYTPFGIPVLYGLMTWAEGPVSGCSTNPARSFGPALVALNFSFYWMYWIGPLAGMLIITWVFRVRKMRRVFKMEAARLSYHNRPASENIKTGDFKE
ncbi:MAG: MIP/aquaporin family protein [Chitinophagales bacterium]